MPIKTLSLILRFCFLVAGAFIVAPTFAQGLAPYDRDSARSMMEAIKSDLKSNYYDPTFRGLDLEQRFKESEAKIKSANSRDQLMAIIAQTLLDMNDSHTFLCHRPGLLKLNTAGKCR